MRSGLLLLFLLAAVPTLAEEPPDEEPKFGGPQVGERAPDLKLRDSRGQEMEIKSLWERKPLVLVTGSHSCPVYRNRAAALERLSDRYGSRARFAVLYTVEAHPVGSVSPYTGREWVTDENRREGVLVKQPATFEERARIASESKSVLHLEFPFLVDGMDNEGWEQYGNAPNACYLIDSKGKVRLRQDWFDPPALEKALLDVLNEEPARW